MTTTIPNSIGFECKLCLNFIPKGEGIQLKNCSHNLCKTCLKDHVLSCFKIPPLCPLECSFFILDTESRAVLNETEMKSYDETISQISKKDQCSKISIVTKNREYIEKLIRDKILMRCPNCGTVIHKSRGCNLVTCSTCLTDLCWIRQMRRWGPGGPGDQTDGCKCGLDGKKCHPDCASGCIPDVQPIYFPSTPTYSSGNILNPLTHLSRNIPISPTYRLRTYLDAPTNSNNSMPDVRPISFPSTPTNSPGNIFNLSTYLPESLQTLPTYLSGNIPISPTYTLRTYLDAPTNSNNSSCIIS